MLDQIVTTKKTELGATKHRLPLPELLRRISDTPQAPSFLAAITQPQINIIAEIKYRSPSHGPFACRLPPQDLARIYAENGAVAISVLTEKNYFDGDIEYLRQVEASVPLLRKDFIVDRYQVPESRFYGASAYLLIVSCLSRGELCDLIQYGKDFQVDALVEVHDPFELEAVVESGARIIGVNNRNLKTFEVDIAVSFDIAKRMEKESGYTLVSESGIDERPQILELRDAGFSAFLIGSTLMDSSDPGKKLSELCGLCGEHH